MSRQLPAQPNLEHLKKQAKAMLEELTRENPNAKLADALHAIAREYGFASWPKLKVHVLSTTDAVVADANPFTGEWIADFTRSTPHSADDPRAATLQFAVAGDTVTIADTVVDASGQERRGENVLVADGNEYVERGYGTAASWRDPRTLEVVVTQSGEEMARARYSVSSDARTLTLVATAKAHNGYPATDRVTVFTR